VAGVATEAVQRFRQGEVALILRWFREHRPGGPTFVIWLMDYICARFHEPAGSRVTYLTAPKALTPSETASAEGGEVNVKIRLDGLNAQTRRSILHILDVIRPLTAFTQDFWGQLGSWAGSKCGRTLFEFMVDAAYASKCAACDAAGMDRPRVLSLETPWKYVPAPEVRGATKERIAAMSHEDRAIFRRVVVAWEPIEELNKIEREQLWG